MSSFLKRFFRPKWQSPDENTRLEAIVSLNPEREDENTILIALATRDPSEKVRRSAWGQFDDLDKLMSLATKYRPSESPELMARIQDLVQAKLETGASFSPEQLVQLMPWMADSPLATRLLEQLDDDHSLAQIARQCNVQKLVLLAVDRIQTEETLKALLNHYKGKDKRVWQALKGKVSDIRKKAQLQAEQQAEITRIIASVEQIASTEVNKLIEARLKALVDRWAQLHEVTTTGQQQQMNAALEICQQRIARYHAEKQREEAEQAYHAQQADERQAALAQMKQAIDELKATPEPDPTRLAALDALVKTQQTRWQEATQTTPPADEEQRCFQEAVGALQAYLISASRYLAESDRLAASLTGLTDAETPTPELTRALQQLTAEIDWPEEFPAPPALQKAFRLLGSVRKIQLKEASDIQSAIRGVEEKLNRLEALLDERALRPSRKLAREISKTLKQLPEKQARPLNAKLALLYGRIKELEDWAGFATQPKQLELCEKMEALATQSIEPRIKAEKIRAMQDAWKSLGGGTDQSLWQRFKTASDKAYEPCEAYFREQNELKASNLEKRQKIKDTLEEFLNSVNWETVDWKAIDKISRTAKREWKEAFPVDFKEGKPLQKQFNRLIASLDERLNTEKEKNHRAKQSLIDEAEVLTRSEDLVNAIEQAKQLQKRWTDIGITDYATDRKLWKTFRAHCDTIFERRDQERTERDARRAAHAEQARQIAEKAELLVELMPDNDPMGELSTLKAELTGLDLPEKDRKSLLSLLDKCARELERKLGAAKWPLIKKVWLEFLALPPDASQEAWTDTLTQWDADKLPEIAPLKRLSSAQETPDNDLLAHIQSPEDACILLEILAGQETPAQDQSRRSELQLARLNAGMKGLTREISEACLFSQTLAQYRQLCLHGTDKNVQSGTGAPDRILRSIESYTPGEA